MCRDLIKRHRQSGFSLVEVLAALVIFSVSIVSLMESIGHSTAMQHEIVERQHALALAENLLESTRASENFDEVEQSGEFDGTDAGFSWRLSADSTDVKDLNEVTATVTWRDGTREMEAKISTLMVKRTKPDELGSGI